MKKLKRLKRSQSAASAVVDGTVLRVDQIEPRERAAPRSGSRCPLCGLELDSEDASEVNVGPLFFRVHEQCADPIWNAIGLVKWFGNRMR